MAPALATNDLFLHVGHVIPIGTADLKASHPTPQYRRGTFCYSSDDYGLRIFRYLLNRKAAAGSTLRGGLYSRAADVNVTLGATSGSTTTAIKKVGAWTANILVGRMYIHLTNATSAGAAPEGETSIVTANTADQLSLDSARPLSAAPEAYRMFRDKTDDCVKVVLDPTR